MFLSVRINGVKQVIIDNEESLISLYKEDFLSMEGDEIFVLHTESIADKLFEFSWEVRK